MRTYRSQPHVNRRQLMQLGAVGGFGLTLPRLLAAENVTGAATSTAKIKSCILIFYYGGPSHIDTFDPKPKAAANVRGEFATIATSAPGVFVGEHNRQTARVMDRVAVVRSMQHPMRNHNSAAAEALCGRTPGNGDLELLADDALSFPCYGASLSYLWRDQQLELPAVALPHMMYNVVPLPGQTAGFLGSAYQPFQIDKDPNLPEFNVETLNLPGDVTSTRLAQRRQLMQGIDVKASASKLATYYETAFSLLGSETVRRSLRIAEEPASLREKYGRNKFGQSLLLARRLVEGGVRFITVYDGIHNGQTANWDSHSDNFARHRDVLIPPTDQGYAALIEDLQQRGLLDETLVIALGEFGRTPRINGNGGRDHWPDCFHVLLAGGGIRGGAVYGSSDNIGAYPETNPVTPGDLAATLFTRFGIDPKHEIHDITGRPYPLANGRALGELFG